MRTSLDNMWSLMLSILLLSRIVSGWPRSRDYTYDAFHEENSKSIFFALATCR